MNAVFEALFESDTVKVKSRLSLLDESCLALRKLDVSMAELRRCLMKNRMLYIAESEAMKAFEYADN